MTRDKESRLYAFAMAAVGGKGTVDNVYHLLQRDRSVLDRVTEAPQEERKTFHSSIVILCRASGERKIILRDKLMFKMFEPKQIRPCLPRGDKSFAREECNSQSRRAAKCSKS